MEFLNTLKIQYAQILQARSIKMLLEGIFYLVWMYILICPVLFSCYTVHHGDNIYGYHTSMNILTHFLSMFPFISLLSGVTGKYWHYIKHARICRIFSNRILLCRDRIYDSVFLREYAVQRKPVFWHILHCTKNEVFH